MSTILRKISKRDIEYEVIYTGQHIYGVDKLLDYYGFCSFNFLVNKGFHTLIGAVCWLFKIIFWMIRMYPKYYREKPIFVVHGDCITVLIGAVYAKFLRTKLVHVEAGYRTSSFFDPFPEMFVRVFADKLSDILFASSDVQFNNLLKSGVKGKIINTYSNTGLDSIRYVINNFDKVKKNEEYAICTIHRYESLCSEEILEYIRDIIAIVSNKIRVKVYQHRSSEKILSFRNIKNVEVFSILHYPDFIASVIGSEFVITDSGGLQQECYYIGKPCLVLRKYTEFVLGLNKNTVLSKFDKVVVKDFILRYKDFEVCENIVNRLDIKPSEVVVNELEKIV